MSPRRPGRTWLRCCGQTRGLDGAPHSPWNVRLLGSLATRTPPIRHTLCSPEAIPLTRHAADLQLKVKGSRRGWAWGTLRPSGGKSQSFLATSLAVVQLVAVALRDPVHVAHLHPSPARQELTMVTGPVAQREKCCGGRRHGASQSRGRQAGTRRAV